MTPKIHGSPQFPQFTTVHHGNCEHCSHHTTTVVPVGCGECVAEPWCLLGVQPQSTLFHSQEFSQWM